MKFKMSDKSLFAILLRSPWWVSLLIVLVFALAARALLPPDYVAVGVLGTFPFIVIAAMAAWRQFRAPRPALIANALDRVAAMSWREFSSMLEQSLGRQGYSVTRLDGTAADFRLERGGQTSLLSCRRWKAANHGLDALRALQASCQSQGADQAIYASLQPVSGTARQFAQESGIRLMQGQDLAPWLMEGP